MGFVEGFTGLNHQKIDFPDLEHFSQKKICGATLGENKDLDLRVCNFQLQILKYFNTNHLSFVHFFSKVIFWRTLI